MTQRKHSIGDSAWMVPVVILAAGAALRIAGMFDDFWLDEILSWKIARSASSIVDIFAARIDNNHLLNTLFLYGMGDRPYWPVYRIPPVIAGIGTVVAGMLAMRRYGTIEALVAGTLLAFSYPLIEYSSESRGYAWASLFAVLAFASMDRFIKRPTWTANIIFCGAIILGILSHLTVIVFYIAIVFWSVIAAFRLNSSKGAAIILARLHLVPLAFLALFYAGFIRHMIIRGAPESPIGTAVIQTLSILAGGPMAGIGSYIPAALSVVLLGISLAIIWRIRRDWFWFFLAAILVAPAGTILLQVLHSKDLGSLYPRYLICPITMAYLALAIAAGAAWRRSRACRGIVLTLLAAYVGGGLWQTTGFLKGTRGHYLDAAQYMASNTLGPKISVGSDDDFRTRTLLAFYQRYVPGQFYLSGLDDGAQWIILQSPQSGEDVDRIMIRKNGRYVFDREFTYGGLSGWSWYLYRRQE